MNKLVAGLLAVLAVAAILVAGWGLVYLPGTMSASATRAIEDFQAVLARDAPRLTLTHGAISANPLTASVSVAEVSLSHANGDVLKAVALEFGIDPFSGGISAVEARALSFAKGEMQTRVEGISLSGLTSETRLLLNLAARGELTMEAVIKRLDVTEFRLRALTVTTPNRGELSLRTVALENMGNGIIGRFFLEGLNVYTRSPGDSGEIILGRLEFTDLNIAEIVAAVRRPGLLPNFTKPVVKSFNFKGFEIRANEIDLVIGRGTLDAIYATNGQGRPYARKTTFLMDDIVMKPRGKSPAMAGFLRDSGLDAFKARLKMVTTADHATRTMAIEELSLRMAGLAGIDFKLGVGNLPKAVFELSLKPEEMAGFMAEMLNATLIRGSLVLSNTRLIQLSLAAAARKQGIGARAVIAAMLDQARRTARRSGSAFLKSLADELEKFLDDPKTLKITVAPAPPFPFHRFQRLFGANAPGSLVRALNLKVEANR